MLKRRDKSKIPGSFRDLHKKLMRSILGWAILHLRFNCFCVILLTNHPTNGHRLKEKYLLGRGNKQYTLKLSLKLQTSCHWTHTTPLFSMFQDAVSEKSQCWREHREHWQDFSAASISKRFTTQEHVYICGCFLVAPWISHRGQKRCCCYMIVDNKNTTEWTYSVSNYVLIHNRCTLSGLTISRTSVNQVSPLSFFYPSMWSWHKGNFQGLMSACWLNGVAVCAV